MTIQTKYDVCSAALLLCGAEPISSFEDGTRQAEICSQLYDMFLRDIFSRYPWTFALKKDRLIRSTTNPVNEWAYNYVLPADLLTTRSVYNTSSQNAKPIYQFEIRDGLLQTNEEEVYLEYNYIVPENKWAGYFTPYAIHALATLLVLPLTDNDDLYSILYQITYGNTSDNEKGGKFRVAVGTDSKLSPMQQPDTDYFLRSRWV